MREVIVRCVLLSVLLLGCEADDVGIHQISFPLEPVSPALFPEELDPEIRFALIDAAGAVLVDPHEPRGGLVTTSPLPELPADWEYGLRIAFAERPLAGLVEPTVLTWIITVPLEVDPTGEGVGEFGPDDARGRPLAEVRGAEVSIVAADEAHRSGEEAEHATAEHYEATAFLLGIAGPGEVSPESDGHAHGV